MTDVRPITEKLDRARAALLAVAENVPPEFWQKRPGPERWSAAEVIAHLTMVESAILEGAKKMMAHGPRPVPFWRRLHIPPKVSEYRLVKRQTPLPLDPAYVGEKDAMLARFRALRGETLAFLEANQAVDITRWRRTHPFFGSLNAASWFTMISHHEVRHTKQLREIVRFLGGET
ncbi:MAG: DinB family protein [Candidatus Acidiferrales bacterium]